MVEWYEFESRPARALWIEISKPAYAVAICLSRPARALWIEILHIGLLIPF